MVPLHSQHPGLSPRLSCPGYTTAEMELLQDHIQMQAFWSFYICFLFSNKHNQNDLFYSNLSIPALTLCQKMQTDEDSNSYTFITEYFIKS